MPARRPQPEPVLNLDADPADGVRVNNVVYQLQDRWLQSQSREETSRRITDALEELATALARLEESRVALAPEPARSRPLRLVGRRPTHARHA